MYNTKLDDIVLHEDEHIQYSAKDFKSSIDVRWCPGCGGYSILAQVQKIMPTLGIPKENIVFVSGIGCSSRFTYYMDIYGLHSLHGRALPIASGLKIARPDLSVWVATGDGDCISIGGNHFIHASRRNVDLNVIMFNNEVYSLTKGQASPTSQMGQKTKSTPLGALDDPFNPVALALGSGASFVARGVDSDPKYMKYLLQRASEHKGFSFMEIYANCVIFNDGAFNDFRDKEKSAERIVYLEHNKPLIFGANRDKGIKLDGLKPVVVSLEDGSHSVDDLLIHNEKDANLGFLLANMTYDNTLPRPFGVFNAIVRPTYEDKVDAQIEAELTKFGEPDFNSLLKGDEFWEIN